MGFKQCRVHKRYLHSKEVSQTNGFEVKVGVGTPSSRNDTVITDTTDRQSVPAAVDSKTAAAVV
jgi:hypothetical protein